MGKISICPSFLKDCRLEDCEDSYGSFVVFPSVLAIVEIVGECWGAKNYCFQNVSQFFCSQSRPPFNIDKDESGPGMTSRLDGPTKLDRPEDAQLTLLPQKSN